MNRAWAGSIGDMSVPPEHLGNVYSNDILEIPFGGTIADAGQTTVVITLRYEKANWAYVGFKAYMNGADVSEQFDERVELLNEEEKVTLNCSSVEPPNGKLSIHIWFRAGLLEGEYTFRWRYVLIAFQEPPMPPVFQDLSGEARAYVSGPYFKLMVKPPSIEIEQGSSATVSVEVLTTTDYDLGVNLNAQNVPDGVSISFEPAVGSPNFTSTMRIDVSPEASPGSYTVTVVGTGEDGKKWTAQLTLVIKERFPIIIYVGVGVGVVLAGVAVALVVRRKR